jgi:hypothetical protein
MLFWFFAKKDKKMKTLVWVKTAWRPKDRGGEWWLRDSAVLGLIKAKSTLFTIVWPPQRQVNHLSEYFSLPSKPIHHVLKPSDYYSVLKNTNPWRLKDGLRYKKNICNFCWTLH